MKNFSGYGAYMLFLALRTHFNSAKYDFFQMHGKLRANKDSYLKRSDKIFFEKIAKRYDADELKDFYVANFLEDRHYITDMLDEDAHSVFFDYQRRKQALTYNFINEIEKVFPGDDIGYCFHLAADTYPNIISLLMRRNISWETVVVLDGLINFTAKFDKYLSDDIIWSKISLKLRKYKPFVKYDKVKMKNILKEKINDTRRERI